MGSVTVSPGNWMSGVEDATAVRGMAQASQSGRLSFMAITLLGLRTVIYPSPDLGAAKSWWNTLLGVEPYFDEPFYVGYNVGGYELGLLPDGDPTDGALTYWGVDDVAAAVEEAVAHGAVPHAPVADVGGGIVTATVTNPLAAIVGFIFNPNFTAT